MNERNLQFKFSNEDPTVLEPNTIYFIKSANFSGFKVYGNNVNNALSLTTIENLDSLLASKLDKNGGVINGDLKVTGSLTMPNNVYLDRHDDIVEGGQINFRNAAANQTVASIDVAGYSNEEILRFINHYQGGAFVPIYIKVSSGFFAFASRGGFGFAPGAGGTVTQPINKTTAITLNTPTGKITTANTTLGAGQTVSFRFNNTIFSTGEEQTFMEVGGNLAFFYTVKVVQTTIGYVDVYLTNTSDAARSEEVVLRYFVIRGASL